MLDAMLRPVPIEVAGRLYIGGVALARAYLNRPDLTDERFVMSPSGERLYHTGDLARYRPDGDIEFLGRADTQAKVRGYRLEIEEIEATLARHVEVKECACRAQEDGSGEKRIVAFVTLRHSAAISPPELAAFLSEWRPDYTIPSAVVTLESMPLTPSGKVDRYSLRALHDLRDERAQPFVAPSRSAASSSPPRSSSRPKWSMR